MSLSDGVFKNLRHKLDVLGYTQALPPAAIPLVGALFEDLIKTTESLRDAKKKIVDLLEEKSCWEMGVEPYKCDNSRLLAECNQLHMQALKVRDDFEERVCESNKKIRNLQTDKLHLEEHCLELQQQLKTLLEKDSLHTKISSLSMRNSKEIMHKQKKKPFISTVRSSGAPPLKPLSENSVNTRCTKCNAGYYQRPPTTTGSAHVLNGAERTELEKLENSVKDLSEQLSFYKQKIEARNREIRRLNELLVGGRPPAALAKDCCYKDVGALSEDIELLQREKSENVSKIREYQDQMHEAMQRAVVLDKRNRELQEELDELKDAALQMESQANEEIEAHEIELGEIQMELEKLRNEKVQLDKSAQHTAGEAAAIRTDKRHINERINELTQKESALNLENERAQKKIHKLKNKITVLQKELNDVARRHEQHLDEEKIRLKSERDFFQKEYLRLLSTTGSKKEVEFLQTQVNSKDEELRLLRQELCMRQQITTQTAATNAGTNYPSHPSTARSDFSNTSACVQAVVLRAERERDCARAELERVRCERNTLREKHLCLSQMQAEESERSQQFINELSARIKELEHENREFAAVRLPNETQIVLLKEEIDELKRRIFALQRENGTLKTSHNQLKILHEQTERSLVDYQNKLIVSERHLGAADIRLNTLDTNCESTRNETTQLRQEVAALKHTYVMLENEKDRAMQQLDAKTERAFQLEYELKSCTERRDSLEIEIKAMQEQLKKLNSKTRNCDTQLHATSTESKNLREEIAALMASRDAAIAENGRLSNELAESQAEILTLKKKLKDSEMEIDRLKQQLRQYVQEVKKAEDLLLHKEKEREEMLEHYRSLSHDAVMLEGNNQSLEVEAAEYKRQICELEAEIEALRKEICCRHRIIEQLEDKVSALTSQNNILEHQLEEALDDQRLLRVDLAARKELCDKLDIQKDKLNAELNEMNEIRRKMDKKYLQLTRDNDQLRNEVEKSTNGNKASAETFGDLLSKTRHDLEEQIETDSKLSQELIRLRQENEVLLKNLDTERQKRQKHESLLHEYQVQNQELRQNLTDDRFRQARSREQSPRFPTQTM